MRRGGSKCGAWCLLGVCSRDFGARSQSCFEKTEPGGPEGFCSTCRTVGHYSEIRYNILILLMFLHLLIVGL